MRLKHDRLITLQLKQVNASLVTEDLKIVRDQVDQSSLSLMLIV